MKKLMIVMVALAVLVAGCSANTSSKLDIDASDIQYKKDNRSGLCFAFVASEKATDFSASGLGFTNVPCTPAVLKLVK